MSFKPTFPLHPFNGFAKYVENEGGRILYVEPHSERQAVVYISPVPDFWGKTPARALAFMESLLPANAFISAVPCMPGEAPRGDGVTVITIHFRYLDDTTTD